MQKSHWSGKPLPQDWADRPTVHKAQVIAYLQGRTLQPPTWWNGYTQEQRSQIVLHLCAVGSVPALAATRKATESRTFDDVATHVEIHPHALSQAQIAAYRARFPDGMELWNQHHDGGYVPSVAQTQGEIDAKRRGMLYPKPNGGKRILPSIYTQLTDRWLRGSGVYQKPDTMRQGHLKSTVALLNESHINLVDRMCHLIGKMHSHLGNRPDLQTKIVDLFHDFEALQVDELYPIVELIASHIVEEPRVRVIFEDDWEQEFYRDHQ